MREGGTKGSIQFKSSTWSKAIYSSESKIRLVRKNILPFSVFTVIAEEDNGDSNLKSQSY